MTTHSPHKMANNPQKAARRSEKVTKAGTQGQPRPMSGKEAQRHLSPGPPWPGHRPPRKSVQNRYNTDPHGTRPWNKITKGL